MVVLFCFAFPWDFCIQFVLLVLHQIGNHSFPLQRSFKEEKKSQNNMQEKSYMSVYQYSQAKKNFTLNLEKSMEFTIINPNSSCSE